MVLLSLILILKYAYHTAMLSCITFQTLNKYRTGKKDTLKFFGECMRKLLSNGLILALISTSLLTGCNQEEKTSSVDLNSLKKEQLIEMAKKEGEVHSVGMPGSWANWVGTWNDINRLYGLAHTDVDLSSAQEIAMFEAEKDNPTKDIGDVGQSFGPVAEAKGVTQKYKTSYWNEIPAWAKDEDGDWIVAYYGTMAVITNRKLVPHAPQSFDDILKGDYMISLGDVAKGTQSQCAVLAAAIAYGGDESNLEPGLKYFRKLAEQGRIDKGEGSLARLEKGEIACMFLWDFNALNYRDQILANNPDVQFDIMIPKEASIQSGYATIINKFAPNPHAAALAREYILSDQGQINLAIGYASPIRDVELPAEIVAKRIPKTQYANARPIQNAQAWEKSVSEIGIKWQEDVMAYSN